MKKIIALIMVAVLMLTFAACGGNTDNNGDTNKEETPAVTIASPVELLNTVWATYADEEKFPVAGGDEANMSMEGPGVFGLENGGEGFVAITHFPAESVAKIDSAATLMHMMNANTFTGAAYHVVDADMAALATEVKDSVMATRWMCGFPEKLVIVTVGEYMVSYFGHADLVSTFTAKLQAAYPSAEVVVDEPIVA
jgi:hypothetical protein